jgi:hypothetical protein
MSANSRPSNRSKLYERYNVDIKTSRGDSNRRWFDEQEHQAQQEVPLEERTNLELLTMIYKTIPWKTKLIISVLLILLLSVSTRMAKRPHVELSTSAVKERQYMLDPDSHKRNNPFAPAGHTSIMEGVLEVKRIGGKKKEEPQEQVQQEDMSNQLDQLPSQHLEPQQDVKVGSENEGER